MGPGVAMPLCETNTALCTTEFGMYLISRRSRLSSFCDMPTHNDTTDMYLTWPRAVSSARCLLHIPNEAQFTGFKTEAHTCTCWCRACEGEGLHNVGWYIALMYWERKHSDHLSSYWDRASCWYISIIAENLNHLKKQAQRKNSFNCCMHKYLKLGGKWGPVPSFRSTTFLSAWSLEIVHALLLD